MQAMTRSEHHRDLGPPLLAGWLSVLVVLGVSYLTFVLWHTSHLFLCSVIVAGTTTMVFGGAVGYRRDWRFVSTALLTGTGILVATLEAAWIVTFFVPVPGGSGGFGEIVGPFIIAVLGGVFSLAAVSAVLGGGVVIGIVIDALRRPTPDPRLPII